MISPQVIEDIKSYIISSCEFELDEDDDIRVKKVFATIYAKNMLRQSKLSDDIVNNIVDDLFKELNV